MLTNDELRAMSVQDLFNTLDAVTSTLRTRIAEGRHLNEQEETHDPPVAPLYSYIDAQDRLMLCDEDRDIAMATNGGCVIVPGEYGESDLRGMRVWHGDFRFPCRIVTHFSAPLQNMTNEAELEAYLKRFQDGADFAATNAATRVWVR